jgi:hypothetical protein
MSDNLKKQFVAMTTDTINQAMGQPEIACSYEEQCDQALQNMNKLVQKILTM